MTTNALMDVLGNTAVSPFKTNEYYQTPLFKMYAYTTRFSHLNDEELKEYFCSAFIPFTHTLPKVTDTLKYKGNLRISWAFDIKYNKNIDLIFFPEDNPYINYAFLFAKDFPKTIYEDYPYPRALDSIKIPYNINYDFVKEILSQSTLSKAQQERFFEMRFGSVFVPMEIEFEWYSLYWSYLGINSEYNRFEKTILFPKYDKYLRGVLEGGESLELCLGVIKSHQVLPKDTSLNFPPYIAYWEEEENEYGIYKKISYSEVLTPLPTAALAITQTNINDYIVNVRDKPNAKEGKIVTQLLSQYLSPALIEPKFQKLQEKNGWGEHTTEHFMLEELEEHRALKQAYYEKEKQNLTNPLNADEYLILVWNIEPNEWAKVWILRMIRDEDWKIGYDNKKIYFKEEIHFLGGIWDLYGNSQIPAFLNGSYTQTFLQSPSSLKLYEGYIHASGLQYLAPFSENYIQR